MGSKCCSERKVERKDVKVERKDALKLEEVEQFCAKQRKCDLPEPETEPVGTGERPHETFTVTNKYLQATSPGLAYRTIKKLDCEVDHERAFAPWGLSVTGHDDKDGWLRVGRVFLPFKVEGARVLVAETSGTGVEKPPDDWNVPRKLRCQMDPDKMESDSQDISRRLRCQIAPDTYEYARRSSTPERKQSDVIGFHEPPAEALVSSPGNYNLVERETRKEDSQVVGSPVPSSEASTSSPEKSIIDEGELRKEDVQVSGSTVPVAQKKSAVRAALKHAATVGDLDGVKTGLKEAGDLGVGASDIKVAWESLAATKRHVQADRVKHAENVTYDESVVAEMRSGLEKQEFSALGSLRRGARKDQFAERLKAEQEIVQPEASIQESLLQDLGRVIKQARASLLSAFNLIRLAEDKYEQARKAKRDYDDGLLTTRAAHWKAERFVDGLRHHLGQLITQLKTHGHPGLTPSGSSASRYIPPLSTLSGSESKPENVTFILTAHSDSGKGAKQTCSVQVSNLTIKDTMRRHAILDGIDTNRHEIRAYCEGEQISLNTPVSALQCDQIDLCSELRSEHLALADKLFNLCNQDDDATLNTKSAKSLYDMLCQLRSDNVSNEEWPDIYKSLCPEGVSKDRALEMCSRFSSDELKTVLQDDL